MAPTRQHRTRCTRSAGAGESEGGGRREQGAPPQSRCERKRAREIWESGQAVTLTEASISISKSPPLRSLIFSFISALRLWRLGRRGFRRRRGLVAASTVV
jgi:hypothetical protein